MAQKMPEGAVGKIVHLITNIRTNTKDMYTTFFQKIELT